MSKKNKTNETNETNVLLLSMSTLNYVVESGYEGTFIEKKNDSTNKTPCYFRGVSQLELGTKYYLRQLERQKRKIINKIFIVESPESTDNTVSFDEVSPFLPESPESRLFVYPGEDAKGRMTNAVDFYKERIAQYIRGAERSIKLMDLMDYMKLPVEKIENYEAGNNELGAIYSQEFIKKELFSDIPIAVTTDDSQETEEELLNSSVQELCKEIKEIAKNKKTVNLYLDMQGARRYETFIINATVNMLDMNSNIEVKQAIAIDYHKDNNRDGKFNQIVDTTFNDRMFKMVSGMNQFITTGRGDLLRQFSNKSQNLEGVDLKSENPIITSISNISDALSVCNMVKFNTEIDKFKGVLDEYPKKGKPNRLFQIFVEDLEADYKQYDLLDDKAKSPIVNRVQWCVSKGLYQQALTLLEAHVPDDIVNNKIIYYGDDDQLAAFLKALMDEHCLSPEDWYRKNGRVKTGYENYVWIHYVLQQDWPTWKENHENAPEWTLFLKLPKGWNHSEFIADWKQRTNNKDIKALLSSYSDICKIRNAINHSDVKVKLYHNDYDITPDFVKEWINKFIDCYNKMQNKIKVDLSQQIYPPEPEPEPEPENVPEPEVEIESEFEPNDT